MVANVCRCLLVVAIANKIFLLKRLTSPHWQPASAPISPSMPQSQTKAKAIKISVLVPLQIPQTLKSYEHDFIASDSNKTTRIHPQSIIRQSVKLTTELNNPFLIKQ